MSVLGFASENKLKNFLVDLAKGEREIEATRQKLASFAEFTLISAFERIDRRGRNAITSSDILHFLRDNSVYSVSESEVTKLIRYFVHDSSKSLRYEEFSQILLPCEDVRLRNAVRGRSPLKRVSIEEFLHRDVERTLCSLFLKEIQLARQIDS